MVVGTMKILYTVEGCGWQINTNEVVVCGNDTHHKNSAIAEADGRRCAKRLNIDVIAVDR